MVGQDYVYSELTCAGQAFKDRVGEARPKTGEVAEVRSDRTTTKSNSIELIKKVRRSTSRQVRPVELGASQARGVGTLSLKEGKFEAKEQWHCVSKAPHMLRAREHTPGECLEASQNPEPTSNLTRL